MTKTLALALIFSVSALLWMFISTQDHWWGFLACAAFCTWRALVNWRKLDY
jgi:hypothetical protein